MNALFTGTARFACLTLLLATAVHAEPAAKPQPAKRFPEPIEGKWQIMKKVAFDEWQVARLKVPAGFALSIVATDLVHPRMILPIGHSWILVSRPKLNDVIAIHEDANGHADSMRTVVDSIELAHGLAIADGHLYIAGVKKVVVVDVDPSGPTFSKPRVLIDDLPDGGQHRYRTIGVGPDGMLFLSIGSDCNDCTESNPEHATMLKVDPATGERHIFARGLRNTIGFDWNPATHKLWGFDIGMDWRGDNLPPEELNRIEEGADYGWPHCWGKRAVDQSREDPEGISKEERCRRSKPAELLVQAHSSPIGFTFYRGSQFPSSYSGDAFSAFRGSWNRDHAIAPRIVRVRFTDGQPVGVEDFVSGFQMENGAKEIGRLAGVAIDSDGSLLFSDDDNGVIYRVSHGSARAAAKKSLDPKTQPILSRVAHVGGLDHPESVLHDEEQDFYFVSSVNGETEEHDGNGYISTIAPDGTIVARKFIAGGKSGVTLDGPKGMAILGEQLWVADIDSVRVFNRRSGAVIRSVSLRSQGAKFLNDVAVGGDGNIYVTDTGLEFDKEHNRHHSGPDRIFRITPDGTATVAIESATLKGPNGIAWDPTRNAFLVVQNAGTDVLSWAPGDDAPNIVVTDKGEFDGIATLPGGEFLVTSWHDQTIHRLHGGKLEPLFARPPTPADIALDRKRNRLLIPEVGSDWVEIWQLAPAME